MWMTCLWTHDVRGQRSSGDVWCPPTVWNETQSIEMLFRHCVRKVLGFHFYLPWDWSQPERDQGFERDQSPKDDQGGPKLKRKDRCSESVNLQNHWQMYPFLRGDHEGKEKLRVESRLQRRITGTGDHLERPYTLSKPVDGEGLFLYLAVSVHALNAALVREESRIQKSVYCISKRLTEAERNYPRLEKLAYCLLIASKNSAPTSRLIWSMSLLTSIYDKSCKELIFSKGCWNGTLSWVNMLSPITLEKQSRVRPWLIS